MKGILFPQNTLKIRQPAENKSSIEGVEVEGAVEGAMHGGLRNVKNAIIHRLG